MSELTTKRLAAWIAIAIPPIAFYVLLACSLTKLPFADDYDSVLNYLLKWKSESGLQHIAQIITSQHNNIDLYSRTQFLGFNSQLWDIPILNSYQFWVTSL